MGTTIPAPFLQQPVGGVPNSKLGIDIQKYRIRSVSIISEATWTPKILIAHIDGKQFSYSITREHLEDITAKGGDIDSFIEKIVWNHIKEHCVVYQRKEKLKRLDQLKVVDIQL